MTNIEFYEPDKDKYEKNTKSSMKLQPLDDQEIRRLEHDHEFKCRFRSDSDPDNYKKYIYIYIYYLSK